ncbi:Alpha/Beta hydrolase protein [Stachybotrys elegans]|uniref:alcohol O-acetyltransferase n=1 Tax=Stachybotrys elegans TaxID=80388 RepID=A0A8K0WRX2_9HYPO|nr:Alpha/Beta hydrolase protein [Stachybotrys elegans]
MEWLGFAKLNFTHNEAPRPIKQKDGQETDLLRICEQTTPPCQLNPLLFNGHLQTMWTATKPEGPKVYYRRKLFQSEHKEYKGTFSVDFVVEPHDETHPDLGRRTVYYTDEEEAAFGSSDSRPMLVIMHGLSGGSHEVYLRHAIEPLIKAGNWEICVVNSRGCARTKITSGILYNARATWDYRQIVKWLRETYPNRPLFGLGFSLGANILTNYCGEEGSNCQLKAAIICSNPFNLDVSNKMLQKSFIGREVYLRVMGHALKELAREHKKELQMWSKLDLDAIEKATYLHEFDRLVQCPSWGYPTEDAYYRDASSSDSVMAIRIPFVALHATDDPIAVNEAVPYHEFRQNPNTVLITTSLGGHLCWFETGGSRWHSRPIFNFFNYFASQVDLDSVVPTLDPVTTAKPSRGSYFDAMRRKMELDEA